MLARLTFLALLAPSFTQAAPLTLPQALAEARAHAFDLRAAQAAVAQAQGGVRAAGALPNRMLTLGAGPSLGCYGEGCRAGSPVLAAQLSEQGALWQLLTGKRSLREEAARLGLGAAQQLERDALRQLEAAVKQQYVASVTAARAIDFAQEVRDSTKKTADLILERYKAGAIDEADVSRVETQRLEAEQALEANRQLEVQQRALLAFLLGRQSGARGLELEAGRFATSTPTLSLDGAAVDALLAEALDRRADVQAAEAAVAQAESTVPSIRRQRVPDVSLFATFGQQGLAPDFSNPPNLTFGLSLPIPAVYRLEGELASAQAALETQRILLERSRAQVRTDVENAWADFQSAQAQTRRMDGLLLRAAARARALVSVQYEKGAASLIEFLDAQRTFVSINVEALQLTQFYWSSLFRLEAAVGQELAP
jgi:outer membrane protein, heavy metal efflux system